MKPGTFDRTLHRVSADLGSTYSPVSFTIRLDWRYATPSNPLVDHHFISIYIYMEKDDKRCTDILYFRQTQMLSSIPRSPGIAQQGQRCSPNSLRNACGVAERNLMQTPRNMGRWDIFWAKQSGKTWGKHGTFTCNKLQLWPFTSYNWLEMGLYIL